MQVKDLLDEGMAGGFDTKMRRSIEHSFDSLRSLAKKDDASGARKHEQDVIDGLLRTMKSNPEKFLYSVLEIVGARVTYASNRYGAKAD